MSKIILHTQNAPAAIGPYSQAVRRGDTLYISGQIGLDPISGKLVGPDVENQATQAIKNLEAILQAAGLGFDAVCKTTVFLTDMADFDRVNRVYAQAFPSDSPARSCIAVAALPKGAKVEVEAVAAFSKS